MIASRVAPLESPAVATAMALPPPAGSNPEEWWKVLGEALQAANKAVQRLLGELQEFALRYAPEKNKFGQGLPAAAAIAVNVIGIPAVVPGSIKSAVAVTRPAVPAPKPALAQPQPKPKRVATAPPKQGR